MKLCKKGIHSYNKEKYSYCPQCRSISSKAYYKANKEQHNTHTKSYYEANKGQHSKYMSEYYNKNKDLINIRSNDYRLKNKALYASYAAKYRASKLQATPSWLTKEQLAEIEQAYIDAQELSWLSEGGLEVDHIIPLQGKNISGLHVPWNLQIIPKTLNRRKSNKV